jgi:autotransporter-associated beta strand protein
VVNFIDFPRWEGTAANPQFWDINNTVNWKTNSGNVPTQYLESTNPHDQVLFTDAAAGTTTVDVTTTVTPSGVTINNGTKNYTFIGNGKISGATFVTKMGTGTATLSNTGGNDYTGSTNINAGTLALGADNVLSDNSPLVISGGTLDINSRSDVTGALILNSGSINGSGGSLTSASYDVRSGTINATLSGAVGLTKTATGTVSLNTPANYAGNTTIAEGTLQLGATDAIPYTNPLPTPAPALIIGQGTTSGTLDMNGFAQQLDRLSSSGTGTANTIVNNVGGPAVVLKVTNPTGSVNTTYAGAINGNIALSMSALGSLTLLGSTSTYTGGTTIDAGGNLIFQGDGALGAVPGVSTQNITFTNVGGRITAGANLGTFSLAATRDIFIDFGCTGTIDTGGNANTMTIPSVISGGGNLAKAGNGILILTNSANTYSGSTTITAGALRIPSATSISSGGINANGGSLQLDSGVSISNPITSNSTADNMIDSVGTGGTATYAGAVTFGSGAQLRLAATGTGATLIFGGSATSGNSFVANQGNIVMVGSSSITASQGLIGRPAGAASISFTMKDTSTLTSTTFSNMGNARNVSDATLTLQDSATFTTATTFTLLDTTNATGTSTVNLNGASILTSGNFLKTSNGASQTSTINFNGGTLKVGATSNTYMPALTNLTVNVNANAIVDTNGFDAVIAQPFTAAGTGGFTKNGAGNLTMSGANTWVGNTTVNAGRLILGNSLTTSSSVSVNNDAVVEITPSGTGTRVIKTGPISIAPAAKVNVQDNKIITTSVAGTWAGTGYTGVTGLIAQGRGTGNLWDGTTGIVTGQTQAIGSNYTSIGVARASDVRPSTATATALWAGQTITGTDTLVMYTYGGDATLDGKINIDDYVKIDSGISAQLTGWSNGDFNYDGKVSIDDYITVIDANIGNQNGIFFTTGGISGGLSGVSAVPEPASGGALLMLSASLLTRRRRSRRAAMPKAHG